MNKPPVTLPSIAEFSRYALLIALVFFIGCLVALFSGLKNRSVSQYQIMHQDKLSAAQQAVIGEQLDQIVDFSFFGADLKNIYHVLTDIEWVEEVTVSRDWQRGVVINVLPRQPVAKFGSTKYVDAQGNIYDVNSATISANHQQLIQLYGQPQLAQHIFEQVYQINKDFKPINLRVIEAQLTPQQTWVFRFNNQMRVIVDRKKVQSKLARFNDILTNQRIEQPDAIANVDLRYQQGMAVRWKDDNPYL